MATKKKSSVKKTPAKKAATKKSVTAIKKAVTTSKPIAQGLKKTTPKVTAKKVSAKKTIKKATSKPMDDRLEKEALKLVDKASSLLRSGIKNSHKTTGKIREKTHQEALTLLEEATRHLDDVLKAGNSFIKKALNKL